MYRIKIILELIIVASLLIKYWECVEVLAQVKDSTGERAKDSRGKKIKLKGCDSKNSLQVH